MHSHILFMVYIIRIIDKVVMVTDNKQQAYNKVVRLLNRFYDSVTVRIMRNNEISLVTGEQFIDMLSDHKIDRELVN